MGEKEGEFKLLSPAFGDNKTIPIKYTGQNGVSPPLRWERSPVGTKSFVLVMIDKDFPWGKNVPGYGQMPPLGTLHLNRFVHWIVFNIPITVLSLPEGASLGKMPTGAIEGKSSFAMFNMPAKQYGAPAPPPGANAHAYIWSLRAIDITELPGLTSDSDYGALCSAMDGHVLNRVTLTGYFGQK